ncbi:MAG: hypothetical protein JXR64_13565 [Spirochaetales bacterium]|nr:hypothetical protein [Spirochaetales bacterium]
MNITLGAFAQINEYSYSLVETLNKGTDNGFLGYLPPHGGIMNGPLWKKSQDNGNIIIADSVNKRLNIYNNNFEYIVEIKEENNGKSFLAQNAIVFEDYIVYYELSSGLVGMTYNGVQLYKISPKLLPEEIIRFSSFFKFKNYILFYNRKSSSYYNIIDKKGNWIKDSNASEIISNNIKPYNDENLSIINKLAIEYFNENKIVIDNNNILSEVFKDHREFYHLLSDKNINTLSINIADKIENIPEFNNIKLKYYDSYGNSYWQCSTNIGRSLVILSRFGEVLDVINISFAKKNNMSLGPVTQSGEIFFSKYNEDNKVFEFYKLNR